MEREAAVSSAVVTGVESMFSMITSPVAIETAESHDVVVFMCTGPHPIVPVLVSATVPAVRNPVPSIAATELIVMRSPAALMSASVLMLPVVMVVLEIIRPSTTRSAAEAAMAMLPSAVADADTMHPRCGADRAGLGRTRPLCMILVGQTH